MLDKIKNATSDGLLDMYGQRISVSFLDDAKKKELFSAIDERRKQLVSALAEQGELKFEDVAGEYEYD